MKDGKPKRRLESLPTPRVAPFRRAARARSSRRAWGLLPFLIFEPARVRISRGSGSPIETGQERRLPNVQFLNDHGDLEPRAPRSRLASP